MSLKPKSSGSGKDSHHVNKRDDKQCISVMGNVVPNAILPGRKRTFDDVEKEAADAEEDILNTPKK